VETGHETETAPERNVQGATELEPSAYDPESSSAEAKAEPGPDIEASPEAAAGVFPEISETEAAADMDADSLSPADGDQPETVDLAQGWEQEPEPEWLGQTEVDHAAHEQQQDLQQEQEQTAAHDNDRGLELER